MDSLQWADVSFVLSPYNYAKSRLKKRSHLFRTEVMWSGVSVKWVLFINVKNIFFWAVLISGSTFVILFSVDESEDNSLGQETKHTIHYICQKNVCDVDINSSKIWGVVDASIMYGPGGHNDIITRFRLAQ